MRPIVAAPMSRFTAGSGDLRDRRDPGDPAHQRALADAASPRSSRPGGRTSQQLVICEQPSHQRARAPRCAEAADGRRRRRRESAPKPAGESDRAEVRGQRTSGGRRHHASDERRRRRRRCARARRRASRGSAGTSNRTGESIRRESAGAWRRRPGGLSGDHDAGHLACRRRRDTRPRARRAEPRPRPAGVNRTSREKSPWQVSPAREHHARRRCPAPHEVVGQPGAIAGEVRRAAATAISSPNRSLALLVSLPDRAEAQAEVAVAWKRHDIALGRAERRAGRSRSGSPCRRQVSRPPARSTRTSDSRRAGRRRCAICQEDCRR